jgi:hypothetical protein
VSPVKYELDFHITEGVLQEQRRFSLRKYEKLSSWTAAD